MVSALLVVSGPSEHGRQRLLSFTHAGGLEPEWRPMHELFVCSHFVPFDSIYILYILLFYSILYVILLFYFILFYKTYDITLYYIFHFIKYIVLYYIIFYYII